MNKYMLKANNGRPGCPIRPFDSSYLYLRGKGRRASVGLRSAMQRRVEEKKIQIPHFVRNDTRD
jgi:hypothetical protein